MSSNNIKVFIRLRPINTEKQESPIDLEINNNEIQLRKANQTRNYYFDGIFSDRAKQSDLNDKIIDPLITQVNEGFNCSLLAYGQTGTGKTFTIEGNYLNDPNLNNLENHNFLQCLPEKAGLVPRAFYKLFSLLKPDDQFKVSVIEIYNEEVFDLLSDSTNQLRIYEGNKGVILNNLKEIQIKNKNDINLILQKSNSKRQFASTLMNKCSSRSHVIYSMIKISKEKLENNQVIEKVGKLNLVDLAGSECAKRTGCNEDIRVLEASNINCSLLTLTRVIDALANKQSYIPFRSSKLTRILQDTLGGNSKTCLIATLSPAIIDFDDTLNTLNFAATVKQVKNNASANVKILHQNYLEDKIKELEENLAFEQKKHEIELNNLIDQNDKLTQKLDNKENELRKKEEELDKFENELESKDYEIKILKRNISQLTDSLQKENNQQVTKKRKSTKKSIDDTNLNRSNVEVTKLKKDVNFLTKEITQITQKVNKLKSSITEIENSLKDSIKKDKKLICSNQLENDLRSFLDQIFNIAIQDEFDLFNEYLTGAILAELNESRANELENKFIEFAKLVREKLDFVIETTDNTLNANEEELKIKTRAINSINGIKNDLNKEIKDFSKVVKKCKDKVKEMKTAINA